MAKALHYKFAMVEGLSLSFCDLPTDFYPSKYSSKPNKIKPLKEDSSFPSGFCSKCRKVLEDLELINKE
tara:strand:- start:62 stop:268 length:207 start_codon:yes stop_codon:yes gene_type:complete